MECMMKKLVVTLLTILTCGAVQALPVGNPGEASLFTNGIFCESNGCCDFCDPCFSWCDAWSIRVGFYGNYVFNRHLEVDRNGDEGKDIEHAEIYTNAGYIALNLCDRFDIFATLGSTTIELGFDDRVLTNEILADFAGGLTTFDTLRFEPTFSWSVGGRATLWECDCFTVGLEGEYFRTNPNADYLVGFANALVSFEDRSVTYSEWQVGFGASYTIATSCPNLAFVPYLAVKWSGAKLEGVDLGQLFDIADADVVNGELPNLNNKKLWGYAVGTSFTLCDVAGVTVEGRFGDEKALYVNGQFRF